MSFLKRFQTRNRNILRNKHLQRLSREGWWAPQPRPESTALGPDPGPDSIDRCFSSLSWRTTITLIKLLIILKISLITIDLMLSYPGHCIAGRLWRARRDGTQVLDIVPFNLSLRELSLQLGECWLTPFNSLPLLKWWEWRFHLWTLQDVWLWQHALSIWNGSVSLMITRI